MTIDIEEINNKGVMCFLRNDFENARLHYLEVLKIDANYTNTLNNLGLLYLQEKKFQKAEEVFQQAYNLKKNATYALNLGHSLVYQNKFIEAEKFYKISINFNDKDIAAWKSLISLYEFTNQIDKAIDALVIITVKIDIDVIFKIQLAKNYIRKTKYQEALDILHMAIQQEKLEYEVWYYIAYIHFKNNNFDLAKQAIETSIEYDNSIEHTLQLAGTISMIFNNLEMTINYWNEILKINPKNNKVRTDKAVVLFGNKDEAEALKELQIVLENEPNNVKAIYYLGIIYSNTNETRERGIELLTGLTKTKNPFSDRAKELLI